MAHRGSTVSFLLLQCFSELLDIPGISRCLSQHVSVESSSLFHHSIYLWFICFPRWSIDHADRTTVCFEPWQKPRARLGTRKTGLTPPPPHTHTSILILTVPWRYFCYGSLLLLVLAVRIYTLVQLLFLFALPRVPFVECCQFVYSVISLLVLRAGCGIWLYQFLIIAYVFTFNNSNLFMCHEYILEGDGPIPLWNIYDQRVKFCKFFRQLIALAVRVCVWCLSVICLHCSWCCAEWLL